MSAAMDAYQRWAKDKTLQDVMNYSRVDTFVAGYEEGEAADQAYRQTLTALRLAQEKLFRMEQALRGIRAAGEGVNHTYAKWVRFQVEKALEVPEERKEHTT